MPRTNNGPITIVSDTICLVLATLVAAHVVYSIGAGVMAVHRHKKMIKNTK